MTLTKLGVVEMLLGVSTEIIGCSIYWSEGSGLDCFQFEETHFQFVVNQRIDKLCTKWSRSDQLKCRYSLLVVTLINVHLYRPQLTSDCWQVIVHLVALLNQMHFWQRGNNWQMTN